MSKFNLANKGEVQEAGSFVRTYISYGIHLLKINGYELKTASTGKVQIKFLVEGPEIKDFVGAELPDGSKAKGLIGRVNFGIYKDLESETEVKNFTDNLTIIGQKCGVEKEVSAISANTVEELLNAFVKIVKGKYAWYQIKGREYLSKEGKKGFELSFMEGNTAKKGEARNNIVMVKEKDFVKPDTYKESVKEVEGRIIEIKGVNTIGKAIGSAQTWKFDITNEYHLTMLAPVNADTEPDELDAAKADTGDDLPF